MDTAVAQLQHRRRTLPEHGEIHARNAVRTKLMGDLVAAETLVSDLEIDLSKSEADLQPVRDRLVRDEHRIADGSVPDPKALSSLVDEVQHLGRRISDLEDAQLELMEQLDTASATRDELRRQIAEIDEGMSDLIGNRDRKLASIDAEVAQYASERAALEAEIPADLGALYEKLRAGHGGVGAAELRQRRCTGCQLEVNAAELRQFAAAPADEVLRCEECSRILIRTAESGL
ncbi:MAG TPA: C4-type zinc ribbon domain-containing protein [Propionibacteriaceae bacterium]|nr:C4-type zinc ribbon domain-containing protein [Propionibacteriaceae bacterium]